MNSSNTDDSLSAAFQDLASITEDPPPKRALCSKCYRPVAVCWCPFLSPEPLKIKSKVFILQHLGEEKRCLRTAPILEASLPAGQCIVLRGRKFSSQRYKELEPVLSSANTVLVYPGKTAVPLSEFTCSDSSMNGGPYNVIILDGTWSQARSIYHNSKELHSLKQIHVESNSSSDYVIRTQPTSECLSTVEAAAITLAALENNASLRSALVKPLKGMCQFQLQHGAVTHHSKEYLILNGMYKKPLPRKIKHKLMAQQDIKNVLR